MSAIQVKNFPADLHAKLRKRAASQGRSVSGYVTEVLKRDLELPTWDQWFKTLETRKPVQGISRDDILDAIHEGREERADQLERAHLDSH
jgi:plasmid stability protein